MLKKCERCQLQPASFEIDYATDNGSYGGQLLCGVCINVVKAKIPHGLVIPYPFTPDLKMMVCYVCTGTGVHRDEPCGKCEGTGEVRDTPYNRERAIEYPKFMHEANKRYEKIIKRFHIDGE